METTPEASLVPYSGLFKSTRDTPHSVCSARDTSVEFSVLPPVKCPKHNSESWVSLLDVPNQDPTQILKPDKIFVVSLFDVPDQDPTPILEPDRIFIPTSAQLEQGNHFIKSGCNYSQVLLPQVLTCSSASDIVYQEKALCTFLDVRVSPELRY